MVTDTKNGSERSDEEMRKLLKPTPSAEDVLLALQKSYAEPGQEIKLKRLRLPPLY